MMRQVEFRTGTDIDDHTLALIPGPGLLPHALSLEHGCVEFEDSAWSKIWSR